MAVLLPGARMPLSVREAEAERCATFVAEYVASDLLTGC
jgi:hypothetical protein